MGTGVHSRGFIGTDRTVLLDVSRCFCFPGWFRLDSGGLPLAMSSFKAVLPLEFTDLGNKGRDTSAHIVEETLRTTVSYKCDQRYQAHICRGFLGKPWVRNCIVLKNLEFGSLIKVVSNFIFYCLCFR